VEAETATEVTDFMVDLFHVSDPSEARGNTITAREVLDKGAKKIQQQLTAKPAVRTRLMDAIGKVYAGLGLGEEAVPILREVLAMRERTMGAGSSEVATSLMNLAEVVPGREGYRGEAVALSRRALAIRRKALGSRHIDTAYSERLLGTMLFSTMNESADAKRHLERALEVFQSMPESGDQGVSWCLTDLAQIMINEKEYDEALKFCREALILKEKTLGPEDPDVAIGLNNVGWALLFLERYSEAKPLLLRSVEISERQFGPEHAFNSMGLQSLGECLRLLGEYAAARDTLERAVHLAEHWSTSTGASQGFLAYESLGALYTDTGEYARADSSFRRAVAGFERGGHETELASTLEKYARLRDREGQPQEATALRARAKGLRATGP
jgi:tetratricopeptide (TPR) repeat protein